MCSHRLHLVLIGCGNTRLMAGSFDTLCDVVTGSVYCIRFKRYYFFVGKCEFVCGHLSVLSLIGVVNLWSSVLVICVVICLCTRYSVCSFVPLFVSVVICRWSSLVICLKSFVGAVICLWSFVGGHMSVW